MAKYLFLILCMWSAKAFGQDSTEVKMNPAAIDQKAKLAVYGIVRYSGLTPNFEIVPNPEIPNAIAYIKNKKRMVVYNPAFISMVIDSTSTNWGAVSVLAHEVGHHLLGHTLRPGAGNPGNELSADTYSGFILAKMGASLDETLETMEWAGNEDGSKYHPPKEARLKAIEQGWKNAKRLDDEPIEWIQDQTDSAAVHFKYSCTFYGDKNVYFIDAQDRLVWYNYMGTPIEIGEVVDQDSYVFGISLNKNLYGVDSSGNVWNITTHGNTQKVGGVEEIEIH